MEKTKTSKKALRNLINESMQEAIGKLDLPKSGKKIEKLIIKKQNTMAAFVIIFMNAFFKIVCDYKCPPAEVQKKEVIKF